MDVVLTGASRGIGRALARALPASVRAHAVARDGEALDVLARERPGTVTHAVDLASRARAAALGETLATALAGGDVTLIHCAGIWPSSCERVDDGLERAFVVNCVAPLALQAPLLAAGVLDRILVIGAGLMIKGRFDAVKTPTGEDFSAFRTYASTKLALAVAMRDVARAHPDVDVAVMHPGVVRTDLGARPGALGWLLERVKRRWEAPEPCAARISRVLARERWSPPGRATWLVEETESPWPPVADDAAPAVRRALERLGLGS